VPLFQAQSAKIPFFKILFWTRRMGYHTSIEVSIFASRMTHLQASVNSRAESICTAAIPYNLSARVAARHSKVRHN